MTSPVIGITGRQVRVRDDFPETLRHWCSDVFITAYAECVAQTGGSPVWLSREAATRDLAANLDGVLVAGGQDVVPRLYGSVPGSRIGGARSGAGRVRDRTRPRGGSAGTPGARQLPGRPADQRRTRRIARQRSASRYGRVARVPRLSGVTPCNRAHSVELAAGSRLAGLLGPSVMVYSHHHQCVDRLGDGLVVTARARDGVVEATELHESDVIGVRWHLEMLREPDPVFGCLIDRCSTLDDLETHGAIA